jgi:protein phosphatase
LQIEFSAESDQGKIRESNEDSYVANGDHAVFLVADGMGGHAAGEIASQIAAAAVEEAILQREPGVEMQELMTLAVESANERVFDTQRVKTEFSGMGSTLTVLTFLDERYYVAQVGDSRAYLFRDGILSQLTQDHSVVWALFESGVLSKDDISRHPQKNLITRSIGTHPEVEVDLLTDEVSAGDVYLLCSDGLTDVLTDEDIQRAMEDGEGNPQKISQTLIREANSGGGPDNITVIVVRLVP